VVLDSAISGHGTGFLAQRLRKSLAYRDGKTIRLACKYPGARPEVDVVCSLLRDASRACCPVIIEV
jgi:hypothetical protein